MRGLILFLFCAFIVSCDLGGSSSKDSNSGGSVCEGQDKPDHSEWGIDNTADNVCQWECEEGYTEHEESEKCYINQKSCDIKTRPEGSPPKKVGEGRKAYAGNGQYGDCEVVSCIGGYDNSSQSSEGNTDCIVTEIGFYSPENSRAKTECSASPDMPVTNAHWVGTGLERADQCAWECNDGYKKNVDQEDCIVEVSIEITGLETVGSKKVTASRSLSLVITGSNVDKWYVTHKPPGTFKPSTINQIEVGKSWAASIPQTYALPGNLSDGDYNLYLYVADTQGNVKGSASTVAFTLDTTAPVLSIDTSPTNPQIGGNSADFALSVTGELAGATIIYEYCFGSGTDCDADDEFTSIGNPLSLFIDMTQGSRGAFGSKTVTFRASDPVKNKQTETHTWDYHICQFSLKEQDASFLHGVRERTCANDGSSWEAYSIISCEAGYYDSGGSCVEVAAGSGYYAPAAGTSRVQCLAGDADATNPKPEHSVWTHSAGATIATDCTWACAPGYDEQAAAGSVPVTCPPEESMDDLVLTITDGKDIGGKRRVGSPLVNFAITGGKGSYWHITHVKTHLETSVRPMKIVPTQKNVEVWFTTKPSGYQLPNKDGDYTLYIWVADSTETLKIPRKVGPTFTLDTTGPVLTKTAGPSANEAAGTDSASFTLTATDDSTPVVLTYCSGDSCSPTSNANSGTPVVLGGLSAGSQSLTFKAVDALGNISIEEYTWNIYHCNPDEEEVRNVANGVKSRTCDSAGSAWSSWSLKVCIAGYDNEDDSNACGETPQGSYSLGGSKARQACPLTPPVNSVLSIAKALTAAHACIVCNSGYTVGLTDNQCHEYSQLCNFNGGSDNGIQIYDGYKYGVCEKKLAFSIDAGAIPNVRAGASEITIKGSCPENGAKIAISIGGRARTTLPVVTCKKHRWERDFDFSSRMTGNETFTIWAAYKSINLVTVVNDFCPDYFVAIPMLAGYVTHRTCVAKYEMRDNGSGVAISTFANTPWSNVSRDIAETKCKAMGADYNLISNDEWQALSRSAEGRDANWATGTKGDAGGLSIGLSQQPQDSYSIAASIDDNKPCEGTGASCDASTWHRNRRTFTLPGGEVIWDLAGSLWEVVRDVRSSGAFGNDAQVALIPVAGASHSPSASLSLDGSSETSRDTKGHFGPDGDYSALIVSPFGGLGRFEELDMTIANGGYTALFRGGSVSSNGNGDGQGVFSASSKDIDKDETLEHAGFRCVYRVPTN